MTQYIKNIVYYPIFFLMCNLAFFLNIGIFTMALLHSLFMALYNWLNLVFDDFNLVFLGIHISLCGGILNEYPRNKSENYRGALDNDFI